MVLFKSIQEKFQTKIQDLQKNRAADAERAVVQQEAAVAAAIEKVRAELSSSASGDDASNRHAEELRALEERLATKHKQDLKAALETTHHAPPATGSEVDHQAAIATAIAEHDKIVQARHEQEISLAVDRGRMEQAAKGKLKDQALVRTQNKLKELEAQVLEWRKAGIIPEIPTTNTAPATPTAGPSVTKTAVPPPPTTPTSSSTPKKKPAVDAVTTPTAPKGASSTTSATFSSADGGRGRGLGRGRGAMNQSEEHKH